MAKIRYRIAIGDAHAHLFAVTLTIPAPAASQTVSLPAWIPGSYLLREFARHLSGLRALQDGQELPVEQLDKASWRIACGAAADLVLHYRVYANDNSVRAAFVDAQRAFFNGTSLCLRVHGRESEPQQIELGPLPEGWQVATGMSVSAPGVYAAADYEELVDHPFELGRFWRGDFSAGGVEHQVVVSGALPSFDGARLLADAQRICASQIAFWHGRKTGAVPFRRGYTFLLNAVDDGYGGLEHRASTALISARRDLPRLGQPELNDGYLRLLGLISHEYFHSWNVKRLKPDGFATLDYTRENYTELLWFFEGFTSYFDELMLVRAGLIDETRYLKLLATTIAGVLATPGRKVQSLAQSSFDAWVKYYRQDENTPNSTISYYGKGSLVALALDLNLRAATTLDFKPASIDDVMRGLWNRSQGGPISEADIFAVVAELGGEELARELSHWVHGTDDLPLPELLARLGVQWRSEKATVAQRLGLRVSESALTGVSVKQVLSDSAAQAAGLSAGDELIGCNGWRLRRLDDLLLTLPAEQTELRFWVSRDQRLLELTAQLPAQAAATGVLLGPADKATPRAVSLRRAWLAG